MLNANFSTDFDGAGEVYSAYSFQGLRFDGNSQDCNARNRDLRPSIGRWTSPDPYTYIDGLNVYQFAHSSPRGLVDPTGLDGLGPIAGGTTMPYSSGIGVSPDPNRRVLDPGLFDAEGWELLSHWLTGKGAELTLDSSQWDKYMRNCAMLRGQVLRLLQMDAKSRMESGDAKDSQPLHRFNGDTGQSGYHTGYQMLHGSKAVATHGAFIHQDIGACQTAGPITVVCNPDGSKDITYSLTYTWNDVMDPNPAEPNDRFLSTAIHVTSRVADVLSNIGPPTTLFISNAPPNAHDQPQDYKLHVIWHGKATVHVDPQGAVVGKGYPFDLTDEP